LPNPLGCCTLIRPASEKQRGQEILRWPKGREIQATDSFLSKPKRVVLIGTTVPWTMMVLGSAMISVALPAMRDHFGTAADLTAWIIAAYMTPYVVLVPLYGRLGDVLGKRWMYVLGVSIFQVGTVAALVSPSVGWLLIGRVVQGVGAACIVPLSIAILSEVFPLTERGRALGLWNAAGLVVGILAFPAGGLLIDTVGWRAVLVPLLVIGFFTPWVVAKAVPPDPFRPDHQRLRGFDWVGFGLLGATFLGLMAYASSTLFTGRGALQDWRLLGMTMVLALGLVWWERRQSGPFISLDIFKEALFTRASICSAARMFVLSATFFLIPLYLADVHHLGGRPIGTALMVYQAALAATMFVGGPLADRWQSRPPVVLGLGVGALALASLALLPASAGIGWVLACLAVSGLGIGLSLPAMHRAAMLPMRGAQLGVAAGMYSMIRFVGDTLGTALSGSIMQTALERGTPLVHAHQMAFWAAVAAACVGIVVGLGLRE
jgi:MFS family permease